METKSKIFYANQELIPSVVESLNLQLEQNYKVTVENHLNGAELKIVKNTAKAWAGGKILKTISLSGAANGQIICKVSGMGWGGILIPSLLVIALFAFSPFTAGLTIFLMLYIVVTIILGIRSKNKLTEEIFDLTRDAIEANKNIAAAQDVEKKCPNCGTTCQNAGFCPECGTKVN